MFNTFNNLSLCFGILTSSLARTDTYVARVLLSGIRNGVSSVSAYLGALELVRNAPKEPGTSSGTRELFGYFAEGKWKLPIRVP